jgi:lipoprotein NlpI
MKLSLFKNPPCCVAVVVLLWLCGLVLESTVSAEDKKNPYRLAEAQQAFTRGEFKKAIDLANAEISAHPSDPQAYYVLGRIYEGTREHEKAVAAFTRVLGLSPQAAQVFHLRGCAQFKLGKIKESLDDFDQYLALEPAQAPHHWQRGIALYYADRFEDGRQQFELHQKVNPSDVENAVWHFLCVARVAGVPKARSLYIEIKEDRRVPMMEIHALFAGKGTVEEVMAATRKGAASSSEMKQRLFYAHLYLGLYFEAMGEAQKSSEHIAKATGEFAQDHYMGDVARTHALLRSKKPSVPAAPTIQ